MPVHPSVPVVDLLVLAGGRGSRLGGRDKGALVVEGRPLLDRVLAAAPGLGGRAVVVGRGTVPDGVLRTLEDPPDGGPVAGIAAGLDALGEEADWVAVVAVDQPGARQALTALHAALGELVDRPGQGAGRDGADGTSPDGVDALAHADATGHLQWLLAIYRRGALAAALAALPRVRDVSVRRLVADLAWHPVGPGAEHVGDVDTWADLADWEGRTGSATMGRHRPELEG
ncbi:hypothetical protein BJF81_12995 [Ornithinimicrobium sp. CNJ-824]|uniref:molybdenum cofactor guanylyltransferase n=1 Tax=Ornithinimicrobium sp. CNJ-824 TaxID=1904966 RepID=UPI000964FD85|nr:NTP transferase domain-containing protein [Ornithinimicrobium sp. CNJ-824]OLT22807.1 hypothetical protein BJF81_12995 [Ornithinimicrobium sp. CNJ-824]